MRRFKQDDWYFDGYTWCGTTKDGEQRYPVSYGDNGTAWAMTSDIQRCLNFSNVNGVERQLRSSLKHDPFFSHHYEKIELVYIKEYPTNYFDYQKIVNKLKIKIDNRWHDEELIPHLMKYGFEPISTNPKIIETGRDDGTFYRNILTSAESDIHKIKDISIKNSCFDKPTYLLKSTTDVELLVQNIAGSNELAARYDDEIKGFQYYPEDILLPCFVVVDREGSQAYSVADIEHIANSASAMLELI